MACMPQFSASLLQQQLASSDLLILRLVAGTRCPASGPLRLPPVDCEALLSCCPDRGTITTFHDRALAAGAVKRALKEKAYLRGLCLALRLRQPELIIRAIMSTPMDQVWVLLGYWQFAALLA